MSVQLQQLSCFILVAAVMAGGTAYAESPIKLKGSGAIQLTGGNAATLSLSGTASHLGKYQCRGEIQFSQGATPGSFTGTGVAVFESANGDLLVGTLTCDLNGQGTGNMAFHWRDSVQFSYGAVIRNTGRFVASRPPGAISPFHYGLQPLGIIAILIGL